MNNRNRAEGWRYAKLSGHNNEQLVLNRLINDTDFQYSFLTRIDRQHEFITYAEVGGINETDVPSVNGNKTKSKTDLKVFLSNNEMINVSIKKSCGGQVYLVSAQNFVKTFESQFNTSIPNNIKSAISLLWGSRDENLNIIKRHSNKNKLNNYELQLKHKSLNAETLYSYDSLLYSELIEWLQSEMFNIAKLVFSKGAAKYEEDWSHLLWYINLLNENNLDQLFIIDDIATRSKDRASEMTYYGEKNGGTTIQLPFGFLQWHQHKMQFHHRNNKIYQLYDKH